MKTIEKPSCLQEFARYAALGVFGMLGLSCYILADTFFIARGLGAAGLAALNLAIPVYSLIHGSGLMLGMGGGTKYAILKGQGAREAGARWFTATLCLGALLAAAFVLAGLFLSKAITAALGAEGEVFDMTGTYLKVILLFSPAFLANDILICFVRNDGDPRLAMLAMLAGSVGNILLDYLLIFPLRLGIFGAVLATGIAPLISMLILSLRFLRRKNGFHLIKRLPDLAMARSILSLGFPSLITELSSGIVIVVFNFILLRLLGNVGVAAYGVIANLSLVVVAIYTGIAQGMQPLVSRAYGHGDFPKAMRVLRYALSTTLAVSCVIYLSVLLFADPFASLFNSQRNAALQEIATYGMKIYFSCAAFVGFNVILSIFFTSVGRPLPAHLISILRGLILIIPMAFLLSFLASVTGVWLAFPLTEGMVALLGGVLLARIYRQTHTRKS